MSTAATRKKLCASDVGFARQTSAEWFGVSQFSHIFPHAGQEEMRLGFPTMPWSLPPQPEHLL
jgi:hypothetical protein